MSSEDPRYKDYQFCFRGWNEIFLSLPAELMLQVESKGGSHVRVWLCTLYKQLALEGGWYSGGSLRDRGTVPKLQK